MARDASAGTNSTHSEYPISCNRTLHNRKTESICRLLSNFQRIGVKGDLSLTRLRAELSKIQCEPDASAVGRPGRRTWKAFHMCQLPVLRAVAMDCVQTLSTHENNL